jgi:serine/threonine protein kinase
MSKLKHPNILHLHEYLETGNNYYLVIDYCNSGDLENHLKKHQFLGEEESVYFLMQVMNGFKELHKNQIMHRDFKLANIFLHDDKLIIGDFGFAKSGFDMAYHQARLAHHNGARTVCSTKAASSPTPTKPISGPSASASTR